MKYNISKNTVQYCKDTQPSRFDIGKLYKTMRYDAVFDDYLVVKCLDITPVYCVFEIIESYKRNTLYRNVEVGRKYITCKEGIRGGDLPHILDIAEELKLN